MPLESSHFPYSSHEKNFILTSSIWNVFLFASSSQGGSRSVVNMEWDKIWAFNKKVHFYCFLTDCPDLLQQSPNHLKWPICRSVSVLTYVVRAAQDCFISLFCFTCLYEDMSYSWLFVCLTPFASERQRGHNGWICQRPHRPVIELQRLACWVHC